MDNLYLPIPKDFVVSTYRKLNKDIHTYNDMECRVHYIVIGSKESRPYNVKQLLPEDFSPESYVEYNADLAGMTNAQLEEHYVVHGKNEKRIYHVDLPENFDVDVYRWLNEDIFDQSDAWLKRHYFQHGKYEGRVCSDPLLDKQFFCEYNNISEYSGYGDYLKDIRQIKSKEILDIVASVPVIEDHLLLVSHDNSIYGATHYLYLLFEQLKLKGFKVKMLEADNNPMLEEKYKLSASDMLYYKKDPTLLYHICTTSRARKIYFNSMTHTMAKVVKYIDKDKLIIHSHEIENHYVCTTPPTFVVSTPIAQQYKVPPKVQPPIISKETLDLMDIEFRKPTSVSNHAGEIDQSKITIGMCGNLSDRKNYKLFVELAKNLKQFNFLWVGGDHDVDCSTDNFYHVKNVKLPYRYYGLMDYFLLTSKEDPCPYVVLENLYVNNRVLTFKDNIYTDHKHPLLDGIYFEYPGAIDLETATEHIISNAVKKNDKTLSAGAEYILKYFSSFGDELLNSLTYVAKN